MAIDTINKRRSALSRSPFNIFYPVPDGTINTQDRAQLLGLYSGIAMASIVVVPALNLFNPEIVNNIPRRSVLSRMTQRSVIHYA